MSGRTVPTGARGPHGGRRVYGAQLAWNELLDGLEQSLATYVDPHFYSERDAIEFEEAARRFNEAAREVRSRVDIAREERAVAAAAQFDDDGC